MTDNSKQLEEFVENTLAQASAAIEPILTASAPAGDDAHLQDGLCIVNAGNEAVLHMIPDNIRALLRLPEVQNLPPDVLRELTESFQELSARVDSASYRDLRAVIDQGFLEVATRMEGQEDRIISTVVREGEETREQLNEVRQFLGRYLVDIAGSLQDVQRELRGISQDIKRLQTEIRENFMTLLGGESISMTKLQRLFYNVKKIIWLCMCLVGKSLVWLHRIYWKYSDSIFRVVPFVTNLGTLYIGVCSVLWAALEWCIFTYGIIDFAVWLISCGHILRAGPFVFDLVNGLLLTIITGIFNLLLNTLWDNSLATMIVDILMKFIKFSWGAARTNNALLDVAAQGAENVVGYVYPPACELTSWLSTNNISTWLPTLGSVIKDFLTPSFWRGGRKVGETSSYYIKPMLNKEQIDNLDKTIDNLLVNVRNSNKPEINSNDKEIKLSKEQIEAFSSFFEFWIEMSDMIIDVTELMLNSMMNELKKNVTTKTGGSKRRKNKIKRTKKRVMKKTKIMLKKTKKMMKKTKKMMKKTK